MFYLNIPPLYVFEQDLPNGAYKVNIITKTAYPIIHPPCSTIMFNQSKNSRPAAAHSGPLHPMLNHFFFNPSRLRILLESDSFQNITDGSAKLGKTFIIQRFDNALCIRM